MRFLLLVFCLSGCSSFGQLEFITKLPHELKENSGIAYFDSELAWFIEDNGNNDNIYQVDFDGNIKKQFEVKNAKNHDWEDLTTDDNDNLYIGDFGNNDNDRKNLVIYKLPNPNIEGGDKIDAEQIEFRYPEQEDFPPNRAKMNFDAEAFFYYDQQLYIFTKNRSNPFNGEAFIYSVPSEKGEYEARLIGKIKTCTDWDTCQITSADISPNGKTIVLMGYGKLWVVSDFTFEDFSKATIEEIDFGVRTQLESVCFKNDSTLLLSDEETGNEGRNLYSFKF
ncbi:hypothetical protein [Maribacter halichondriae]|uniref:hypothetical protein n=1 Tax=Maribacter halichondriae TaxID=2980554 RepID=UPI0023586AD2|nr:hypothetical protein [Maribacter sp. Hal144]